MELEGRTATGIRMFAWATPAEGMSLDDLVEHMKEIGNEIMEIDRENNCIKVADVTESL